MIKKEIYSATISIDDQHVLLVKFKNDVEVGIDEAVELVKVSLELVNDQPFYLLVDARDILSSMDHDARKYIAEHEEYNHLNIAQAIVVNNMSIRLLANFYFRFYSHANPVKIFSEFSAGRKWLFNYAYPG